MCSSDLTLSSYAFVCFASVSLWYFHYTETELNAFNSGVPTEYYEKCDVIIRNCDVDPVFNPSGSINT